MFQRGEGITMEGGGHGAVGVGCLNWFIVVPEIWGRILIVYKLPIISLLFKLVHNTIILQS